MSSPGPDAAHDEAPQEMEKAEFTHISDLEPERVGFSIHCRVYSVKRKLCREQLDGEIIRIYEAVVYDDTAAITMTLKGENQISAVKPGDNLTLRNVKISMHNFHMRLACDRWGLIEKDSEERIKAKLDEEGREQVPTNVSDQEYERVDDSDNDDQSSPRRRDNRRGRGRGRGGMRGGGMRGRDSRGPRGRGRGGRGRGRGRGRGGGSPYDRDRRGSSRGGGFRGGRGRGFGRGRGRGAPRRSRGGGMRGTPRRGPRSPPRY